MNDGLDPDDLRGLERVLRDEAAALRRTPRASLAEQVLGALPERRGRAVPVNMGNMGNMGSAGSARAVAPELRPSALAIAARCAVAAALVAGLFGLWTWDTVEHAPERPATGELASAPRAGLERFAALGDVDVTFENPLLEEARRLGRDASSATGFLASRLPPTFRSALLSGF